MGAIVRKENANRAIAEHVRTATRLFERMKGLLGSTSLPENHALWIARCNSIHTFFMRYPIDAVFLSKNGEVVRTYENLLPFRMTPLIFKASSVLELPTGSVKAHHIRMGDRLLLEETK